MSTALGEGDVILQFHVSTYRRMVTIGAILALGAMMVWLGITSEGVSPLWQAFVVVFGIAMVALARRYHSATSVGLELTSDEVRDTAGRVICDLSDVEVVDRSIFGFKPSNGVSLRVKSAGVTTWQLGLWWQMGRRIGIGGSTSPAQNKALADTIKLLLEERRLKAEGKSSPFDPD